MGGIRLHQLLAVLVLLAAGGLGADRQVLAYRQRDGPGPRRSRASRRRSRRGPRRRTVLVAEPKGDRYSRAIRVSGRTEPDKTSILAARDSGIIRILPAADGQYAPPGPCCSASKGRRSWRRWIPPRRCWPSARHNRRRRNCCWSAARAPRSPPTSPGPSWRPPRRSSARRSRRSSGWTWSRRSPG